MAKKLSDVNELVAIIILMLPRSMAKKVSMAMNLLLTKKHGKEGKHGNERCILSMIALSL